MIRITRAFLLLLLAPLQTASADEPAVPSLRLVAYNIKHGRGMDGKVDLARIADVIKPLHPDLVALQEVDEKCTRSGGIDQAAELGKLLGMEHRFGHFMEFQGGRYGLAVLSRHPILETRRHELAPGAEPRCALEVVVQPFSPGPRLSFLSIHHDWTREDLRVAQVRDLLQAITPRPHPVVLAGDFNAQPGAASLALLREAGFLFTDKKGAKTFSSTDPRIEIDYIMTRGLSFDTVPRCEVIAERMASDHRPILTTIPLVPARP